MTLVSFEILLAYAFLNGIIGAWANNSNTSFILSDGVISGGTIITVSFVVLMIIVLVAIINTFREMIDGD